MISIVAKLYIMWVVVFLSGCSIFYTNYTGTMVDAETGKPIRDGIIYAEWVTTHRLLHGHSRECDKAILTRTDKNGNYKISGPHCMSYFESVNITFYKEGYEIYKVYVCEPGKPCFSSCYSEYRSEEKPITEVGVLKVKKDKLPARLRLDSLKKLSRAQECLDNYKTSYDDEQYELFKSIFDEFYNKRQTNEDIKFSHSLCLTMIEPKFRDINRSVWTGSGYKDLKKEKMLKYIKENLKFCDFELPKSGYPY